MNHILGLDVKHLTDKEILLLLQCTSQTITAEAWGALSRLFQLPALNLAIFQDSKEVFTLHIQNNPSCGKLGSISFEWHIPYTVQKIKDDTLKEVAKVSSKLVYNLEIASIREEMERTGKFSLVPLKVLFNVIVTSTILENCAPYLEDDFVLLDSVMPDMKALIK